MNTRVGVLILFSLTIVACSFFGAPFDGSPAMIVQESSVFTNITCRADDTISFFLVNKQPNTFAVDSSQASEGLVPIRMELDGRLMNTRSSATGTTLSSLCQGAELLHSHTQVRCIIPSDAREEHTLEVTSVGFSEKTIFRCVQ